MTERILVANLYGAANNQAEQLNSWLEKVNPDVGIFCETNRLVDDLKKVGRVYTGGQAGIDGRVDNSVLLTHGKADVSRTVQLTKALVWAEDHPRWTHDRWYTRVRKGDKVYFAVHANAVICQDGEWMDNPGAVEWRENGLPKLMRAIALAKRSGYRVRVGGDFNFGKSEVKWSPDWMWEKLGFSAVVQGVMWMAWDPKKDRLNSHSTLRVAPGADGHKSILVELVER